MSQQASSIGHRLILPNRRLYPGSTPYTEEESKAFDLTNPTEEVAKAFLKEGEYLLLFVSNLIEKHSLKKVILVGWSLGTMFLCSAIGSITALTDDTKSRLLRTIRAFVFWGSSLGYFTAFNSTDQVTGRSTSNCDWNTFATFRRMDPSFR